MTFHTNAATTLFLKVLLSRGNFGLNGVRQVTTFTLFLERYSLKKPLIFLSNFVFLR